MSSSCLPLKLRLLNVLHRCLQLSCLLNDFWPSHHLFSLYRSSLKPFSLSCHRIILLSLVLIRWCPIYSQCSPHARNDTVWPITRELISSFFLMVQRALCTHSHEIVPHSMSLQQHCCKWNGLFASVPSPSCSPLMYQSRCRQTALPNITKRNPASMAFKTLPVLKPRPLCAGSAQQQLNRAWFCVPGHFEELRPGKGCLFASF